MAINLSIAGLFETVFGYRSPAFEPEFQQLPEQKKEGVHGAKYWSPGMEYYLPVEINVGAANAEALGDTKGDGVKDGKWLLPYPVISVSSSKLIVDTQLTERSGMVSELINVGGWIINIKGFLIGENNEFPERDFATLNRLYSINRPVLIDSVVTDALLLSTNRKGSDEVVIRRLSLPVLTGVPGVRPYELEMTSNEPFNLVEV